MSRTKRLPRLVWLSVLASVIGGSHQGEPTFSMRVQQSDGRVLSRTYILDVPSTFRSHSGALLIALHGGGQSGAMFRELSRLDATAEIHGFAVAFPDAWPDPSGRRRWNALGTENRWPTGTAPDDVAFLRQLMTTLQSKLQADPKKIYVTGLSSGGFMAHREAVEASDLVASIAAVSGALSARPQVPDSPFPPAPVSVLVLHGDRDINVPYCGSDAAASQDRTFDYWSKADGCTKIHPSEALCDEEKRPTAVVEKHASGCRSNSAVTLYRLLGGEHVGAMENRDLGNYNPALGAATGLRTNEILWNFFAAHPKS